MTTPRLLALGLLLAACNSGPKGPPPTYTATAIGDTLMAPVVHISDAVERSDSTWVVLGIEEGAVLVANFGAGTVTPYPGITPEEVPGATGLFAAGDTIFVADWGLRRVTAWTPDGKRVDAIPAPDALRGAFPRARDGAGQWYFEVTPPQGPDGMGIKDSSALVRADAFLTRFDTVAMLTPPEVAEVDRSGRKRLEIRALAGRDRWGVLRDGTVWVARINQNQLFWFFASGGRPAHTRPLPDPILPVTEMDRQRYLLRYPEANRPVVQAISWAIVKPAFERAFAAPGGRVWLFKSGDEEPVDTLRTFQVADSTGWLFNVDVPSYGMALGVTPTEILMGEENPDGIRLLRFRIPPEARYPPPPPPAPTTP